MTLSRGDYRVSVRDFGPIAEAQVTARPLTVFVGPSHSEWVMETIGNLVSASRLAEDSRERIAGCETALAPEEVGVWRFREGEGGSTAEEITLDLEVGLYPAGYDRTADALYNDNVRIFNELQRLREEAAASPAAAYP